MGLEAGLETGQSWQFAWTEQCRRRGSRPQAAQPNRGPVDSSGAAGFGKIASIDALVRAMAKTAFTGRQLGEAADVLKAMALDEDAFVVMTLAGAMTVASRG